MSEVKQLEFYVNDLSIKAQAWGEESGHPVLALHGWLDNSASFKFLAPKLDGYRVIALDLAGHGFSGHRRGVIQPYNIWEDIADVVAIADQLGWDRFSILGHSRGAIIGMLTAATFPERVLNLVEIDGLCPLPEPIEKSPEQLRSAIDQGAKVNRLTTYPAVEKMIEARMKGHLALSRPASEAIIYRGSIQVDDGYQWSSDPKLKNPSSIKLSIEHVRTFLSKITAPVYLAFAADGLLVRREEVHKILAEFPEINTREFPGNHHFHMETLTPEFMSWIFDALGRDTAQAW